MYLYMRRYGLMMLALAALSGCADFASLFSRGDKHHTGTSQKIDAAAFIEDLSIARITLENGGDLSSISNERKTIEGYSKQKKNKPANLTLLIFEYDNGHGKAKRAIAPVSEKSNLDALSNVLTALNATSYKLKDVRVVGASVTSGAAMKLTGKDLPAVTEAIEARHQLIISNTHKIPPLQEAKQQLKLLHFFIGSRQRDAAYICADNTKRLLATVSQEGSDAAAGAPLTKDLEIAEGQLRQSMPY